MADLSLQDTSLQEQHYAEPVPEAADFLLRSELSPEQGVFFGDLITLKAPFSANTYIWKKDGKILEAHGPDMAIKSFTPEDIGEYSVEDELRHSSATIVLVRHKAPIKYCQQCGKRNHAHSKKCNTCNEALPIKEKPPKRKHESLSMKNYEDHIINKIAEMKENFGDDVDVLFVVSRTQYSRVLTTVKGTEGAAQQFLATEFHTVNGVKNMQCMIQDAWSLTLDQYYNAKGGRLGKKSGKWKKSRSSVDGSDQPPDEGAVHALFRALAPVYQPSPQQAYQHQGYQGTPQGQQVAQQAVGAGQNIPPGLQQEFQRQFQQQLQQQLQQESAAAHAAYGQQPQ